MQRNEIRDAFCKLSSGTKNVSYFDQAACNVACMAHMLGIAQISPSQLRRQAFYVIAPKSQIAANVFGKLVTRENIGDKVRKRVADYNGLHDVWFESIFKPTLDAIDLRVIAWEEIIESMPICEARN